MSTMSDELELTDELDESQLQSLLEQLGSRDWRISFAAETALTKAGEAGMAAAIQGLSHPSVQVRRGCAGYMDHHGTDACFPQLRELALYDPAPSVRRTALHSATCQRCKECPLTGDLVGLFVQVALLETNRRVRLNAIWGLKYQPPDPRAVAALESILNTETDWLIRKDAYHALKRQSPSFKAMVDARARERGMAEGRAIRMQRMMRRAATGETPLTSPT